MTWHETHQRTRIIREVEALAAADLSGALPWRAEWSAYFDGPGALLTALQARWDRMCETQLDTTDDDQFRATYGRLRRSQAGVLAILRHAALDDVNVVFTPTAPARRVGRLRSRPLRRPVLR